MIKLFWNTHNQNKPNPNKSSEGNTRDQLWGVYHKDYSNKWIYEILNKVASKDLLKNHVLENSDLS